MCQHPTTMQAVRFSGVGEPLTVTQVPMPQPRPGWALVRVRAVAICGSDLHILEGHTAVGFTPITLGHEISGDVVSLGEPHPQQGIRLGDRVFVNPILGCGSCTYCESGESNFCPNRGLLGIRHDGGMAEYLVAPVRNLTSLPARVSHADIAMVESAGTAHHAVRALGASRGAAIVVIGAGGLGLQTIRIAVALGLRVVALDHSVAARERAREAGAERVATTEELEMIVAAGGLADYSEGMGSSYGFAHAVDCVGSEQTVELALNLLRPHGSCSVIGIGDKGIRLPAPGVFVRRSLELRGVYTYTESDIASVIELLVSGQLDLSASVSMTLPLEQAEAAVEVFRNGSVRPIRVVLEP